MSPSPVIGVLALQGDFQAHATLLERLGMATRPVRTRAALDAVDALVIPGGESTTMRKLLDVLELRAPFEGRLREGLPVFGTCAGAILLAQHITNPDAHGLSLLDLDIERNAYGRQIDSFIAPLVSDLEAFDGREAVFIRAPRITRVGDGVRVLARVHGDPVLVQQGNALVATFHPELTHDETIHRYFVTHVVKGHDAQTTTPSPAWTPPY
ncbi:MAG: pyridoxal 5'-phosphate synthase glutaminase subunit PdxT [Planctomycetes bacterium]|nr:pyridoxal 5'-phosphate synthase glutaminase subunit PdxT [Planctomycetota bacterium]